MNGNSIKGKVMACGMSCRLPESENLKEFWDQLISKVDFVTDDNRRWDSEFLGLPRRGGILKDISKFDAAVFGILPKQVNKMDPQLRLLLEVSYEAIVDAGFSPRELKGSNTGVYVASSYAEADIAFCRDMEAKDGYAVTGSFRTFLANRLSFFYDFKGPSYTVDAACATGLIALHNAIHDILKGQCDSAIVSGVTMTLRPQTTGGLDALQILAPDGKCKTFDKSANGFVRSEAVVAVFISRESLCRRVYGHLVHSEINHCGFVQQGISYPSFEAQRDLLKTAYSEPGVSAKEVEFVETHGTGTNAGDPIETDAIYEVFCQKDRRENPLLIGSLKSNIGHCECTAGLASLLKVLLTMNHGVIPPNLHFETPNPQIKGLQDGTLKVVTEPTKFNGGLIGISSFGFGGSNAHVIVKPHKVSIQNVPCDIPKILISSGRTKEGVQESLTYMSDNLKDAAFHRLANQVANSPVSDMPYRGYKILSSQNNTAEVRKVDGGVSKPIWYVFSGMGSDWPGMGKDLMVVPAFRRTILRCHESIAATDPQIDLLDLIMNGTKEKLDTTMAKFVTNISIQVALVNCLKDLQIHPDGIIGHSMGETACAYADGILTEEQAVMAAYWRGRCVLDALPPIGCMASVGLGWKDGKDRLPAGVVAACRNADNNTTISGDAKAVEWFLSEMAAEGVFARKVRTNGVAYHSPHMVPIAESLQNALSKIIPHRTLRSKLWISTSFPEDLWDTEQARWCNASYLVNNLVSPVLFLDAVRKIPPAATVIEIAPHGLMRVLLKRSLHSDCDYISLMNMKEQDNLHYFLSTIGKLFSLGVSLDLSKLYPLIQYPVGTGTPPLSPGVRWDHSNEWAVPSWEDFVVGGSGDRTVTSYDIDVNEDGSVMFLRDHNIDGRVLYPATGYIVLAWRAVAYMLTTVPEYLPIDFSEINFHRATILPEKGSVTLTVRVLPAMNSFEISENDELAVSGKYSLPEEPFVPGDISPKGDDNTMILHQDDIYKEYRLLGYRYGPKFQGIKRSQIDGKEAFVEWNGNWVTFLDSVMQVTLIGKSNPSKCLSLPTRLLSLRINPLLHPNNHSEGEEIPVIVDRVMGSCRSGGVEIVGLHTTMVQKRQVIENPILEYVQFIPYGESKIAVPDHLVYYGRVCKEYFSHLLRNISFFYPNKPLKSLQIAMSMKDLDNDVALYLDDDECGYIKVLHQIGHLKESNDFLKDVWKIMDTNAPQVSRDKLLSFLVRNEAFKSLLHLVWENSTARKITVVEIGARYGGLFRHIVPSLMSEPLLELDFIASDTHPAGMSAAFEDQLQALSVKPSQFDINDDSISALSSKILIVVRGLAQQSECIMSALQKIYSMLAEGGFLLLNEVTSNFEVHLGLDEIINHRSRKDLCQRKHGIYFTSAQWEENLKSSGFELIQQVCDTFSSTIFLCRKVKHMSKDVFISVSGNQFDWVEEVKMEMNKVQSENDAAGNIWLIAEEDYHSGIVGCIFNADDSSDSSGVQLESSLMDKLARKDLVMNVFRDGTWGSYRHLFVPKDEGICTSTDNANAYVNALDRGDLSSLCWIQSPTTTETKPSHQIPCTVYYSSLNFRDIMIASGKLSADAIPEHQAHQECLIGIEFAGKDPSGKRVMGIVSSKGLATSVNAESEFLFDVPDSWSLEDAATVPVVYCTVYYALVVRGLLKRGESILIHSGSGGVGQAAIAIALNYGCQIFTTVGTNEKRQFLLNKFPTLKESAFSNSRDLSFEEHVMNQTKGLGVNMVLNSLAEEKLDASLRCLSKNGRFLEIGKYDLSQNRKIGASIFLKNTSFHGIHVDQILDTENTEWLQVVDLVKNGLRSGVVQPIARTVFGQDEVEKAFRYMAQGKHIGKVLIKVRPEETATTPLLKSISVKSRNSPHPNKVYIIVGGLGGFGLELADWLVTRGCMKLVLTSRSGLTSGYQARRIRRWESLGAAVCISKIDTSERNECNRLLLNSQKMGPIGGVFNLALVLKDGLLENLTSDDFRAVCKPKIEVARNLDKITRQICGSELEWFVMFSSVSCGRGNAGQSNYGYANSAMERLCEERNKDNLPGMAIQWGVIGDVGIVVESMNGSEAEIGGCVSQSIQSCLSTLDMFLLQPYPVLSSFVLADRDKSTFNNTLKIDIESFVAKFFGIEDVSSVNQDVTLAELGLDSLMGVEVKQTLERDFATVLSMKQIRSLTLKNLLNDFGNQKSGNIERTEDNIDRTSVLAPLVIVSPILSLKDTDCLVQLNIGEKQNPPVFLVHPVEGTIDVFRPMIPKLKDYPVYALKVTKQVPQDSVSDMATYFLSKIRSVQRDGPYNIAGYSYGAIVALEIAICTQNENNTTPQHKLMLVDAGPDFVKARFRIILESRLEEAHVQAIGMRDAMDVQILTHFIQLFKHSSFDEIRKELLTKATYQERLELAVSLLLEVFSDVDEEDMAFSVDSFVKRSWAVKDYQPKSKYKGNITLLKAKTSSQELFDEESTKDYNLSKMCTGEVNIYMIDGDHETIMQEPRVQDVAQRMGDFFRQDGRDIISVDSGQ